ncbi:MAG: aldo/keto reductase [Sandaracinus sp.]|nr:aldo/keto reductase [Sandaracinus sp.]
MKTNTIGSLSVSAVGLGCNNFGWHIDQAQTQKVVDAALDAGITLFDTADVYGEGESETMLGKALGDRRDQILIASKAGMGIDEGGGAPAYLREQIEGSLKRLGTDRIDLYYLHQPDPSTPIADTLGLLSELVAAGKVREIACSNFSAAQLAEAEKVDSGSRFVAVQNEYSLLHRAPEKEGVLAACQELDIAFVPYFPLKSGLLTGKYRKGKVPEGSRLNAGKDSKFAGMGDSLLTDENLDIVEKLIAFAEERDHTILELAFSWLLAHPAVASVIAGATKPEQIHGNAKAASWELTDEERRAVDAITGG